MIEGLVDTDTDRQRNRKDDKERVCWRGCVMLEMTYVGGEDGGRYDDDERWRGKERCRKGVCACDCYVGALFWRVMLGIGRKSLHTRRGRRTKERTIKQKQKRTTKGRK